jgi:hypothetical protein
MTTCFPLKIGSGRNSPSWALTKPNTARTWD